MTEVTEVKDEGSTEIPVNNTFIQCPKCTRLHEIRVLICENVKCRFSHEFPNGVEVSAEAGATAASVNVEVPIGTQPTEDLTITPPDPTAGGAP